MACFVSPALGGADRSLPKRKKVLIPEIVIEVIVKCCNVI